MIRRLQLTSLLLVDGRALTCSDQTLVRCDSRPKPASAARQQHQTWVALSILLLLVPLWRPTITLLRVSCRRRATCLTEVTAAQH